MYTCARVCRCACSVCVCVCVWAAVRCGAVVGSAHQLPRSLTVSLSPTPSLPLAVPLSLPSYLPPFGDLCCAVLCRVVTYPCCGVSQEERERERDQLMFQIREQGRENKLLEQLVGLFLLPSEMSKVRGADPSPSPRPCPPARVCVLVVCWHRTFAHPPPPRCGVISHQLTFGLHGLILTPPSRVTVPGVGEGTVQ